MLRTIEQRYVTSYRFPHSKKRLTGCSAQLDPHTVFIPASQALLPRKHLEGNFSGVACVSPFFTILL
jgi:hypothetical protein